MKQELALELSEEKTLISHPTKRIRFLGYHLQSRGGRRKTLKLDIPRDAQREQADEQRSADCQWQKPPGHPAGRTALAEPARPPCVLDG